MTVELQNRQQYENDNFAKMADGISGNAYACFNYGHQRWTSD